MLYDFDEFYNLGFSREVEMNEREFSAVARTLRKEEALRFIKWWRKKQKMLTENPLWMKRIIDFHRGGQDIQHYSAVVSGSGGNSTTISPPFATTTSADGATPVFGPQIVSGEPIFTPQGQAPIDAHGDVRITSHGQARVVPLWSFTDFPDKTVTEICATAYEQLKEIVQEAEKEFGVQL